MADNFGLVKNTIRLRSGRYLDLLDPSHTDCGISDIAGGLSKICRFGGQVDRFYSVAEHCVACAIVARNDGRDARTRLAVLLHDAAEAFIGDVVKPLKVMLPDYKVVERRVEDAIGRRFGVDFNAVSDVVREIDHAMLIAERRALFSADDVKWAGEDQVRRLSHTPLCLPPRAAENLYLEVYEEIQRALLRADEVLR